MRLSHPRVAGSVRFFAADPVFLRLSPIRCAPEKTAFRVGVTTSLDSGFPLRVPSRWQKEFDFSEACLTSGETYITLIKRFLTIPHT